MWVVDTLIAFQDALTLVVEIRATIVMIVVASRVVSPSLQGTVVVHNASHGIQPIVVGTILLFLFIRQSVVTHILLFARAGGGSKSIGLGGLYGYLSPLGSGKITTAIHGHTALVEFLTIAQDILGNLA